MKWARCFAFLGYNPHKPLRLRITNDMGQLLFQAVLDQSTGKIAWKASPVLLQQPQSENWEDINDPSV